LIDIIIKNKLKNLKKKTMIVVNQ